MLYPPFPVRLHHLLIFVDLRVSLFLFIVCTVTSKRKLKLPARTFSTGSRYGLKLLETRALPPSLTELFSTLTTILHQVTNITTWRLPSAAYISLTLTGGGWNFSSFINAFAQKHQNAFDIFISFCLISHLTSIVLASTPVTYFGSCFKQDKK